MQNSRENIVVVGSINSDITTYVHDFPKVHETIMADRTSVSVGGKGLNQAVAAARAGANVAMVACVGNDQFGEQAIEYLIENGVSVDHVNQLDGIVTGTASIFVIEAGENMIAVSPGANFRLTPQHIDAVYDLIAAADVLIVQLEVPIETSERALEIARKEGVKTIFNPAPANAKATKLLPLVDIVTPNETEAEALTGIYPASSKTTDAVLQKFHELGTKGVVITKGEAGSAISIDGQRFDVGAIQVDLLDPTGAGDVFNGAFAVGLAREYSFEKAARYASAAAAISVTRPMAEGAAPSEQEIKSLLSLQSA